LALDEVRPFAPLDCEPRLDRLEPAFEREPALVEPELFDFFPDFVDREREVDRAIWSLPRSFSAKRFEGGYTRRDQLQSLSEGSHCGDAVAVPREQTGGPSDRSSI